MQIAKNPRWITGGLALVVLLCAAFWGWRGPRLVKAVPLEAGQVWPETTFRGWSYYADPAEVPAELQTRGSRIDGRVEYMGEYRSGWFRAERSVTLLVAGFPTIKGNALSLEVRTANGGLHTIPFAEVQPRECWRPWRVDLPRDATAFRVCAVDGSTDGDGWLAVSEPVRTAFRADLLSQIPRTLLAFLVEGLLFTVVGVALFNVAPTSLSRDYSPPLVALLAAAAVALLGYLTFWMYFAHPLAGRIFSWSVLFASAGLLLLPAKKAPVASRGLWQPLVLAGVIGVLYLSLLMLYEPSRLSFMAANRFDTELPPDNEIPRAFTEKLWKGESPRRLWGDWLSSDRPPLQVGWQLITWPVLHALHVDVDTAACVAGVQFQLLWVLAVCGLAMAFGATQRQALGLAAAVACSGVLLEFSVFVWPKLAAAAFVIGAYLLWFESPAENDRRRFALGGALAALGWLAHGGVAFSLIAIAPLALAAWRSISLRRWVPAALVFLACAAPWIAYQRWYEPPGNRLLKWHLAGVVDIDARGFGETLVESYRAAGPTAWTNKWTNLRMQFDGNWRELTKWDFSSGWLFLRASETTFTVRGLGWWMLGLLAPLCWIFREQIGPAPPARRAMLRALAWWLGGLLVWLALMFRPNSAMIHQGTLVTQLLAFTLLAVSALYASRWLFTALALIQAIWFVAAWAPASRAVEGNLVAASVVMAVLAGVVLLGVIVRSVLHEPAKAGAEA